MSRDLVKISRALRKKQTPHEVKLWKYLRGRRFSGFKFRRQFSVGPYFADFCCLEKKLVIELDGGGHAGEQQREYDLRRDAFFRERGFEIIRIWNNQLHVNFDNILNVIYNKLQGSHL